MVSGTTRGDGSVEALQVRLLQQGVALPPLGPSIERVDEDLGQTLAVYGLGDGCYLVWPLYGPSTLRDSVGTLGDQCLNPVRYVEPEEASIGVSAVSVVNQRSFHQGEYETLKSASVDPYIAMRTAYVQYRRKQILDESPSTDPNSAEPQPLP